MHSDLNSLLKTTSHLISCAHNHRMIQAEITQCMHGFDIELGH